MIRTFLQISQWGLFNCSFFFIESLMMDPRESSCVKSTPVQLDHAWGALIRRQDGDIKVKNIMTPAYWLEMGTQGLGLR